MKGLNGTYTDILCGMGNLQIEGELVEKLMLTVNYGLLGSIFLRVHGIVLTGWFR